MARRAGGGPVPSAPGDRWFITRTGEGFYTLTAKHSGKALDVTDVSYENGAPLQQWGYGGGANQQFAIDRTQ